MGEVYPLFRNYSLAVREWLRDVCTLPRFERYKTEIEKITKVGTTDGGVNQHEVHLETDNHRFQDNHPIQLDGTEINDEYYVIKKVSGNVLILSQEYRRLRAEQVGSGGDAKRSINIIYGNMERSIASIAQPLRNGLIDSPGLSFYVSDYQYRVEKSRPVENYYTRRYKDNNGNRTGVAAVPPMQEYQLHYNVNIWTIYMQEMDILSYQVVTSFNPEKYFWIGDKEYGFDYTGDRMNRQFKGQWAHSLVDTIADTSDLEPGDAANRTLRTEIGFMVNNAFLPLPFDLDQSMIGSIDIETVVEDRNERI